MNIVKTIKICTAAAAVTSYFAATPVFALDTVDDGPYPAPSASYSEPTASAQAASTPSYHETEEVSMPAYTADIYWDLGIYMPDGSYAQTSVSNWSDIELPATINYRKVKGYDLVEGGTTCVFKGGQTIRVESNLALYPIF